MYKRILVATDGSALSKKAVVDAIGLAATCGAELIALKVVPRYPMAYFEGSIPLNAKDVARIETQWANDAQAAVDIVKKLAEAKDVKAKGVVNVVECGPGKVLAGMVKRIDADMTGLPLFDPASLAEVKGALV